MDERRPLIAAYMDASRPMGVIYTGLTNNLYRRGREHRDGLRPGFTQDRRCGMLVWFQPFDLITTAIRREKALKSWLRAWKMQLIEQRNPGWADLYPALCGQAPDPRLPLDENGEGSVAAFLQRLEREAADQ